MFARMLLIIVSGFPICCACFAGESASQPAEALNELSNVRVPAPNRWVSGAIDAHDIELLREAGVRHVINLRPLEELPDFDERAAVSAAGLQYHYVPIKGPSSLTRENVHALDRALAEIGEEPALLHCSSGNRVGAVIALREAWIKGQSPEVSIAEGKRWGLVALENTVRDLLRPANH